MALVDPYKTLGYPRTQVLASRAMQVAAVQGGALVRFAFSFKPPDGLTDMFTDSPVPCPAPRFHSLPASWAGPSSGPAASQPLRPWGPKGHAAVQSQLLPFAAADGRSETCPWDFAP